MNVAEWILVAFLSVALLTFLILVIVLIIKLIGLTNEAKKIIITGQGIADNVKDMTSVGGLVKTFVNKISHNEEKGEKNGKKE